MTPDKALSELVVDAVLAEFAAMRAEIDRRSNEQHALMGLSITATATLAAFVISKDRYELLPLVPVLTAVLGMRWLDHHRRIREIGDYIRDDINERLSQVTSVADLLGAEKELEGSQAYRVVLTLLVATTFAFPPFAAVAGAVAHHDVGRPGTGCFSASGRRSSASRSGTGSGNSSYRPLRTCAS